MVKIYYSCIENRLSTIEFSRYLRLLPVYQQAKILKFKRWEYAHMSLFGKLLLKKGLIDFGYTGDLEKLKYTEYQRPYIENCIDFNISHSGSCVVCAFFSNGRIGIDIEKIKQISIEDFKSLWTEQELETITSAKNLSAEFFKYWTMKEAIIKADGKGLNIPLKSIIIKESNAELDSSTWYLHKIDLWEDYVIHTATNCLPKAEFIEKITF